MKKLRSRFDRFCYKNRHKGIPNLMLYTVLGSAIVYLMSMVDRSNTLYYALCFNRDAILQGQIWRLFTYAFTYNAGQLLLTAIGLFCYFSLGRAIENSWGTLKFNLFYFTGIALMDIYGMLFGTPVDVSYLNMSLFLAYATMYPDAQFLFLFIIPVRAWIFGLIDLILTLISVYRLTFPVTYFPHNLFPLVAIANYFLFFGKDVANIIPLSWRINAGRLFKKKTYKKKTGSIPFPSAGSYQATTASVKAPYTHRCTICGRTDVSNPELEFRYCSRCSGYHCYCQDHISDHTHVQ